MTVKLSYSSETTSRTAIRQTNGDKLGQPSSMIENLANPCLHSIDHFLDFNGRKMAVVNLEAVLTNWQAIKSVKVSEMSRSYRTSISGELRIKPSRMYGMPSSLLSHLMQPDR